MHACVGARRLGNRRMSSYSSLPGFILFFGPALEARSVVAGIMDIGLKRRDDKEKEARDAIDVAKKGEGTMQQFLTDRLHVVYRPGTPTTRWSALSPSSAIVLPEVALFDSMVKDAVAITPETRKVDPTTKGALPPIRRVASLFPLAVPRRRRRGGRSAA